MVAIWVLYGTLGKPCTMGNLKKGERTDTVYKSIWRMKKMNAFGEALFLMARRLGISSLFQQSFSIMVLLLIAISMVKECLKQRDTQHTKVHSKQEWSMGLEYRVLKIKSLYLIKASMLRIDLKEKDNWKVQIISIRGSSEIINLTAKDLKEPTSFNMKGNLKMGKGQAKED